MPRCHVAAVSRSRRLFTDGWRQPDHADAVSIVRVPNGRERRRSRAWLAVLLALLTAQCGRAAGSKQPIALDAAAESYVRLTLALGDRDPDSLDSYHGPAEWQAEARRRHATLDEVAAGAAALMQALEKPRPGSDEKRRRFLLGQLRAIAARVDILKGARPRFDDEVRVLFGLDVPAVSSTGEAVAVRAAIDRLLPPGRDLAARYAAFDRAFLIPADRLAPVMARAVAACRTATAAHLDLPPGERVDLVYVRDRPWSAFTRYQGSGLSRIEVNTSMPLTVDRALDLACHEAYPGHHTIDTLLERRGGGRTEWLVRPLFSPQSLLHEAAASIAGALAFPEAARVAIERDELFPVAGLDPVGAEPHVRVSRLFAGLRGVQAEIAKRYLDGELDFPRASAALAHDALMPSADATLKFLNQYRTYAATYTIGADRFSRLVGRDGGQQREQRRWQRFAELATDPAQILPAGSGTPTVR